LFFRRAGANYDSRCSASTVNSPAKNLVFTAGACVHKGFGGFDSGWHTNVVFVPGYREGSEPYRRWYAKELWTNSAWANSNDPWYDVGAVVFYPNASGQRLVDVVGANGIVFNYVPEQYTYAFGYPRLSKHDKGERLYYCSGTPTWNGILDAKRMDLKCNFGGWSSGPETGGPWVMRFDGELGDLHSITSYYGQPGALSAIQFYNSEMDLYNAVRVRY
jgi:hypothetical protein